MPPATRWPVQPVSEVFERSSGLPPRRLLAASDPEVKYPVLPCSGTPDPSPVTGPFAGTRPATIPFRSSTASAGVTISPQTLSPALHSRLSQPVVTARRPPGSGSSRSSSTSTARRYPPSMSAIGEPVSTLHDAATTQTRSPDLSRNDRHIESAGARVVPTRPHWGSKMDPHADLPHGRICRDDCSNAR